MPGTMLKALVLGDVISVEADLGKGTVTFFRNDEQQGEAVSDMKAPLSLMVALSYDGDAVTIVMPEKHVTVSKKRGRWCCNRKDKQVRQRSAYSIGALSFVF